MTTQFEGIAGDLENLQNELYSVIHKIDALKYHESRINPGSDPFDKSSEYMNEISFQEELLSNYLDGLATRIFIYSEAMELSGVQSLILKWREKWSIESLKETTHWSNPDDDGFHSIPFVEINRILSPMLVLARPSRILNPEIKSKSDTLEYALRSLAMICRSRRVIPKRELDVQKVLHSHLQGIFPDYTKKVVISKPMLSFEPDGGVPSLNSAIECKYICNQAELKVALRGLTEDLSGYAGTNEWTRFYSVCYMTEAFAVEAQITAALGASGNAGKWTTIVVTGAGIRKK